MDGTRAQQIGCSQDRPCCAGDYAPSLSGEMPSTHQDPLEVCIGSSPRQCGGDEEIEENER